MQKSSFVGVMSGHTFDASRREHSVTGLQLHGRREMFAIEIKRST